MERRFFSRDNPRVTLGATELGDIIKKHDDLFPGAYRKMADAMWGIVSNQGRHIKEEGGPMLEEALFVVESITNLAAYLLARGYRGTGAETLGAAFEMAFPRHLCGDDVI